MSDNLKTKPVKPEYSKMKKIVTQCSKKNMGTAVIAVFLFVMLSSICYSVALVPFAASMLGGSSTDAAAGTVSLGAAIATIVLVVAVSVVIFMMLYGLMVIMMRFIQGKPVSMGLLFSGFKDWRHRVFRGSMIYAGIFAAGILLLSLFMFIFNDSLNAMIDKMGFVNSVSVFVLIFMAVLIILNLPFVFVWCIMYVNPEVKTSKAFGKSFKILNSNGRLFHFLGFAFYSGGIDLIIAVCVYVIAYFIPDSESETTQFIDIISLILSFVGFVAEYKSIVKILLSVPVYYFSILGLERVSRQTSRESVFTDGNVQPVTEDVVLVESNQSSEPDGDISAIMSETGSSTETVNDLDDKSDATGTTGTTDTTDTTDTTGTTCTKESNDSTDSTDTSDSINEK